jgi:hypothetical protein
VTPMDVKQIAKQLASKGRFGDTHLLHVSDAELRDVIKRRGLTLNPKTGLPEAWNPSHGDFSLHKDSITPKQVASYFANPLGGQLGSAARATGHAKLANRVDNANIVASGIAAGAAGGVALGVGGGLGASAAAAGEGYAAAPPPPDVPVPLDAVASPPVAPPATGAPPAGPGEFAGAGGGGGGDSFNDFTGDFSGGASAPAAFNDFTGDFSAPAAPVSAFNDFTGTYGPGSTPPAAPPTAPVTNDTMSAAMRYGPLALGGAGAIYNRMQAGKYAKELNAVAQPQRDVGNSLLAQYQAGKLNPADQFAIDQWKNGAIAQTMDYYAKNGMADSTMAKNAVAGIASKAEAMRQAALNNLLTQGNNILNTANQYQQLAIQAQQQGDMALMQNAVQFLAYYGYYLRSMQPQTAAATHGAPRA